jgi:serine/threonine protein kinase
MTVAERQFGPYKLIRQIAVGGMAEIHLAKTAGIAGFEKYVALKMIHPNFAEDDQFIQMLVDEAKIAVQLTHGNIAQTFDLGRVGEIYYITMEYVDGADLYKILRRASEQDIDMPLDVCAFIGKEISSALDHAHRKRDHVGKSLGIVHRDVSPQNVLVSYSGEVKLVDFGIAKATMKARQTAVGVIKGKYYYMSPEQAWGNPIDHRSDIFSAGIVLYEMITGQMLYLEEDLHKLLEMARSAEIRPPGVLRKGVPPQLERIIMHALAKDPGDRYQSAGDLATDLERFLHTYSPVFTASKLSALLRDVIGDPLQVPSEGGFESIEFRDGVMSTHPLDDAEVAHAVDRNALRDENSVIFRMSELAQPRAVAAPAPAKGPAPVSAPVSAQRSGLSRPIPAMPSPPPLPRAGMARVAAPGGPRSSPALGGGGGGASLSTIAPSPPKQIAPRVTRATDPFPVTARPMATAKLPTIAPSRSAQPAPLRPTGPSKIPQITKPRQIDEDTRPLEQTAPADPLHDDASGLLALDPSSTAAGEHRRGAAVDRVDQVDRADRPDPELDDMPGHLIEGFDDDLDNIGERTQVSAAPGMTGFMMDASDDGDGPIEATLVTAVPAGLGFHDGTAPANPVATEHPTKPRPRISADPPAALSARIHAPAVSELRKPRPSRRTPPSGAPIQPNILQAIVAAQSSEPMPVPRPPASPPAPPQIAPPAPPQIASPAPPQMASPAPPPMAPPAPPQIAPPAQPVQMPPELQPPGQAPPGFADYRTPAPGAVPVSGPSAAPGHGMSASDPGPGAQAGYGNDASGLPLGIPTPPGMAPHPASPSVFPPYLPSQPSAYAVERGNPSAQSYAQAAGMPYAFSAQSSAVAPSSPLQLDELASYYQIGAARRRWFGYIVAGTIAVSVAAASTFFIVRSMRDTAPALGSVRVESVPPNAEVLFDGTRMPDRTPTTIQRAPVGSRHSIRVELAHYAAHDERIEIPARGGEVVVLATLKPVADKIVVDSVPPNAEIRINSVLRGRTPKTIDDIDRDSATLLELRLKDYQPYVKNLKELPWPSDGRLRITARLIR